MEEFSDSFLSFLLGDDELDHWVGEWCFPVQSDPSVSSCPSSSDHETNKNPSSAGCSPPVPVLHYSFSDVTESTPSSACFTSVLKLSDIRSALQGFSKFGTVAVSPPAAPPTPVLTPPCPPAASKKIVQRRPRDLARLLQEDVNPGPKRARTQTSASIDLRMSETPSIRDEHNDVVRKQHAPTSAHSKLSAREIHIQAERIRRKSMRDSFTVLKTLVPSLKLKVWNYCNVDRAAVLTEVIAYISSLRGTLKELHETKCQILGLLGISEQHCWHSIDNAGSMRCGSIENNVFEVTVRLSGSDVFVTVSIPNRRGVWSAVLSALQELNIDVLNATFNSSGDSGFHCIRGKVARITEMESVDLKEKLEGVIKEKLQRSTLLCAATSHGG